MTRPLLTWLVPVIAVALTTAARQRPAAAQFAAGTELVEVYASVTDGRGVPVKGLPAAAFTVLEDGMPQPIAAFTAVDVPLTIAVVIDRSFSMGQERFDAARAAARRLIGQLGTRDRLLVLAVGGRAERVAGFDSSRAAARDAVDRLSIWGTSPLGDTIVQALDAVAAERGRRAVVLLSDGLERESQRSPQDVLERVKGAGVLVYPVALAPQSAPLLAQLAAVSGGRVVLARTREDAERAATAIADELRCQYLLGYAPPAGKAGWRAIEVRVQGADLHVRARQGYFAQSPPGKAS